MNRDEGSYQLSHAYDRFLDTASSRSVVSRIGGTEYQLLLTKASDRGRFRLCLMNLTNKLTSNQMNLFTEIAFVRFSC